MTSLNKNIDKVPYKKEGRTEINENLRFSTLTVAFFLTSEAEQKPCLPIFTHARCTWQKVNLPTTHCACMHCPKFKTQFLIDSLSVKRGTVTTHRTILPGVIMIVLSHPTYMSVNFPKVKSVTSVKRWLYPGNPCISQEKWPRVL